VREVNARNAVECELIDEALGRVLARIAERGWAGDVDVGVHERPRRAPGRLSAFLFKGPYHVDALMRVPLIWRPAQASGVTPSVVTRPSGWSTWPRPSVRSRASSLRRGSRARACRPMTPTADSRGFDAVFTDWDSELFGVDVHLRTVVRDDVPAPRTSPGPSTTGRKGSCTR